MVRCTLRLRFLLLLSLVLTGPVPSTLGDGGIVRSSELAGPWRITLFSSPTPFRAGPVDLSVLVQDPESDQAILDATVNLMLQQDSGLQAPLLIEATRADATNKLLYAALLDLPSAGNWQISVSVQNNGESARLETTIQAGNAIPPILGLWTWLSIPAIVVLLFLCNQWLARRRGRHGTRGLEELT